MPERELTPGHYARKQIHCPSRLVAFSHGSRFELARRLVSAYAGGALLDYGCGDGTFAAMVHDEFERVHGIDVEPAQIEDCRRRLGDRRGVSFGFASDLDGSEDGAWAVVTCMEVLEHCVDEERRRVVDRLARLCSGAGRVVISVPIEIGPSVIGKQLVRAFAGLRGLGDYAHRERYSPIEMMRSAAGLAVRRVTFSGDGANGPFSYYGHKGFDWRVVEREISERMTIERRMFSPLPLAGALLNSQVWFICRPRP